MLSSEIYTRKVTVEEIASSPRIQRAGVYNRPTFISEGTSTKISFIIPPGLSSFTISPITVSSWSCAQSFKCKYAHYLEGDTSSNTIAKSSTGYSLSFVVHGAGASDNSTIRSSEITTAETRGHFIVRNEVGSNHQLRVSTMVVQMTISNVDVFNAWVGSNPSPIPTTPPVNPPGIPSTPPPTNGGGGTQGCGGLSGNPCTPITPPGTPPVDPPSTLSQLTETFKKGMANIRMIGGLLSEDSEFIYWDLGNHYDFNNGQGDIETNMLFRINKNELEQFIQSGQKFEELKFQYGHHTVKDYKFWTVHSSDDESGAHALYLYPNVVNVKALESTFQNLSNVIHVSMSNHGVLYVVTDDNRLHRGVLNEHSYKIAQPLDIPEQTMIFEIMGDLNGDGHQDYGLTYANGIRQYLYYLPPPL